MAFKEIHLDKRKRTLALLMVLLAAIGCLAGCGSDVPHHLSGSYFCPDRDYDEYVLTFSPKGAVSMPYLGEGTYRIGKDGMLTLDISLMHAEGRVNPDASIDLSTGDGCFYHYVPKTAAKGREDALSATMEERFDKTLMLGRMPFEYDSKLTVLSGKQVDGYGRIFYQMTNDGSSITGTVGTDKALTDDTLMPSSREEAVMAVMDRGIKGSIKCIEGKSHFLVLVITGLTDINSAVYYMYLIPRDARAMDKTSYYAAMYFYDKDRHTDITQFTGIKNGLEYIAGDIFPYTYQDVMHSLSEQRLGM